MRNWIQTIRGRQFDLLNPTPEMIDPEEIAIGLSRINRFGGHYREDVEDYSVGQHSILVCDLVESEWLKLAALLHDAHEVYWGFGDICRPAKHLNRHLATALKVHANRIDAAVAKRFGFNYYDFSMAELKEADNIAMATEVRCLMTNPMCWTFGELPDACAFKVEPWPKKKVKEEFMRYLDLYWKKEE
jgi:uncharacterized protein